MPHQVLHLVITVVIATSASASSHYTLTQYYHGTHFFDNWTFFTDDDPTGGYVDYIDLQTALNDGLIKMSDDTGVYIGSDSTNIADGRGRKSIRITTNNIWNKGLFVADLGHMPEGCGTWPAWWLAGPSDPQYGEIDILEGRNNQGNNSITLHSDVDCDMSGQPINFTGAWASTPTGGPSTDCWVGDPDQYDNQGCSIYGGPYGEGFNTIGGGLYAIEWTDQFIRVFFLGHDSVPADLESDDPDPDQWGVPLAYFPMGENCSPSHFVNQSMIMDLTFCGQWTNEWFASQCPGLGDCNSYVQYNPQSFSSAYWLVNYIKVYQILQ